MNHCTDDELLDYLHHELDDAADALVHAHLAQCADCRSRHENELHIGELIRASSLGIERELPAMVRAGVWAAIRAQEPTPFERLRAFFSPALALPVAAVLVLFAMFGLPVIHANRPSAAPTISALYYFEEHAAEGQENPLADHLNVSSLVALDPSPTVAGIPLIDAADAATLDDLVARH